MKDNNVVKRILNRMFFLKISLALAPFFLFFIICTVVVFVVLFGGSSSGSGSDKKCVTVQTANSVCNSISVGGYGTMSVDDYVAGVVQNEFGGAPEETLKAQAIAARSYGLAGAKKDGNGNCSIDDTSEGFQTFDPNPNDNVKEAVKATSGMVLVDGNGNVARSEYSSNSLPAAYDSYEDIITMSERNLQIPRDWFSKNKTCSNDKLNTATKKKDAYGRVVYGCGHGRGMGQIAAKYLDTEKHFTYDQIIDYFYGNDSEYKWSLASSGGVSTTCTGGNGTLSELTSYNVKHNGLNVLSRTLNNSEISDLNSYIDNQIKKAGYGTGAGVAAAGQSLVYWLEQKGFYLQYYWGGGHGDGDGNASFTFANPNWGSSSFGSDHSTRSGRSHGPYLGMDCSGFVSWSTRTACQAGFEDLSGTWLSRGNHISLNDAQPGDVLDGGSGTHVQLVIKNNGDGSVVIAEESGSNGGLIFNLISSTSYTVVSMQNWYSKNCTTKG